MKEPKLLKVEATIPRIDNPEIQIMHKGMFRPTIIAERGLLLTAEQLLHRLGRQELNGIHLSVSKQLGRKAITDRLTGDTLDISHLQTKPIDTRTTDIPNNYGWYNTGLRLNEDGEEVEIGWVE